MAFKGLQEWTAKKKAEYMSHVSPEFLEWLEAHPVVTEEARNEYGTKKGMNSYERQLMYPKLDNAALLKTVEYCLSQCQRGSGSVPPYGVPQSYDDVMMLVFVPLLLERLKKAEEVIAKQEEKSSSIHKAIQFVPGPVWIKAISDSGQGPEGTRQVMPKVDGKSFRCPCGCNVFTEIAPLKFECNSCKVLYSGEK